MKALECTNPFSALTEEGKKKLRADLEQLWASHNEATDGSTRVHAEYLQVVATRIAGFCTLYFGDQAGEQSRMLDAQSRRIADWARTRSFFP